MIITKSPSARLAAPLHNLIWNVFSATGSASAVIVYLSNHKSCV